MTNTQLLAFAIRITEKLDRSHATDFSFKYAVNYDHPQAVESHLRFCEALEIATENILLTGPLEPETEYDSDRNVVVVFQLSAPVKSYQMSNKDRDLFLPTVEAHPIAFAQALNLVLA